MIRGQLRKVVPVKFREIVDSIAEACKWTVTEEGDTLSIEVPTGGDRKQVVVITNDVDIADQPIVR